MKKLTFLLSITVLLSSCSVPSMGIFETKRQNQHLTHSPRFGANDTVKHIIRYSKPGIFHSTVVKVLIIDSAKVGRRWHYFYDCHDLNGNIWAMMPENSISKI